jgi:hypothetical protein
MAFAMRQPAARRRASAAVAADDPAARGTAADGTAARGTVGPRRVGRGRVAAARGAWAVGSGMLLIARIIRTIAGLIAALIVVAIVLRVLGANAGNTIVKDIHDAAKFFVGPFDGMFSIKGAKLALAVNWGIAALVYAVVGSIIASFIARLAPTGVHPREPVA